jgi:hypothetical protein
MPSRSEQENFTFFFCRFPVLGKIKYDDKIEVLLSVRF